MHLAIHFCISWSSVVPSRRICYFLEFSVNFSLFTGQILIWSLFISLLSMNTSSYSPIASGTYNRWKVEFVLKTKMTKTSIQRRLWRNFVQRGLVVPIYVRSSWLLFEGNASLKSMYSGWHHFQQFSSRITTVSGCYSELNAAWWFPFFVAPALAWAT